MGYTTAFEGRFKLNRFLKSEHAAYLKAFSKQRHMQWRVDAIETLPDPVREAAELPLGENGGYYVGDAPEDEIFLLDENEPPTSQPGLWCQWAPTDDGEWIEWNGMEKFYY